MMPSLMTLEINLVYPWSPTQCIQCKQVLMWVSPTFFERGETNQTAQLLWPLVATGLGDVTECPSLLWSWVAMGSCDINGHSSLLSNSHSNNGWICDVTWAHFYLETQQGWAVRWYHQEVTIETGHKMLVVKVGPSLQRHFVVVIESFSKAC
jgi:hypothetical protein